MAPSAQGLTPADADRVVALPDTPGLLLGPYYPLGAAGGPVLWAAGSLPAGRCRRASDPGSDRVLDGFAGHGRTRCDAQGAFTFHTCRAIRRRCKTAGTGCCAIRTG